MDTLKNEKYKFNLITEKWIKVLTIDYKTDLYSLEQIFESPEKIICLSNEDCFIDTSIYNLLLTILYVSYNRDKEYCKLNIKNFRYNKDIVLNYLMKGETNKGIRIYDLFYLFDENRPFLQVKKDNLFLLELMSADQEIKNKKSNKSEGMKEYDIKNLYFVEREISCFQRKQEITEDWIARHLLSYRNYHPYNATTPNVNVNVNKESNILYYYFCKENLLDFFKLNFNNSWYKCEEEEESVFSIYPEWEIEYDENYLKNGLGEGVIIKRENQNKKLSFVLSKLFNKDESKIDIARFLTYSNVLVSIERNVNEIEKSKFYIYTNIPITKELITVDMDKKSDVIQKLKRTYNIIHTDTLYKSREDSNFFKLKLEDFNIFNGNNSENIEQTRYVYISKLPKYGTMSSCIDFNFDLSECDPLYLLCNIYYKANYILSKEVETEEEYYTNSDYISCFKKSVEEIIDIKNKFSKDIDTCYKNQINFNKNKNNNGKKDKDKDKNNDDEKKKEKKKEDIKNDYINEISKKLEGKIAKLYNYCILTNNIDSELYKIKLEELKLDMQYIISEAKKEYKRRYAPDSAWYEFIKNK